MDTAIIRRAGLLLAIVTGVAGFARPRIDYTNNYLETTLTGRVERFNSPTARDLLTGDLQLIYLHERMAELFSPIVTLEAGVDYLNWQSPAFTGSGKFELDFFFFSLGGGPVITPGTLGFTIGVRLGLFMESNLTYDRNQWGTSSSNLVSFQYRLLESLYLTSQLRSLDEQIAGVTLQEMQILAGAKYYLADVFLVGLRGGAALDNQSRQVGWTAEASLGLFVTGRKRG